MEHYSILRGERKSEQGIAASGLSLKKMVSFVLTRLESPSRVVDACVTVLTPGEPARLVLARRHSLEVYSLPGTSRNLSTRKIAETRIFAGVTGLLRLSGGGSNGSGLRLALSTDIGKVLIIELKTAGTSAVDSVVRTLEVPWRWQNSSIIPGTLAEINGDIWFCMAMGAVVKFEVLNDEGSLKTSSPEPEGKTIAQITEQRHALPVAAVESFTEGTATSYTVLQRDEDHHFHVSSISYRTANKESSFENNGTIELHEPVFAVLPRSKSVTQLLFSKNGLLLIPNVACSDTTTVSNELSSSGIYETHGSTHRYVKKVLPEGMTWEVTAAVSFSTKETLFITSNGEVYISIMVLDNTVITSWKVHHIAGILPNVCNLYYFSGCNFFLAISNSNDTVLFHLSPNRKSIVFSYEIPSGFPILDVNISGTALPKLQVCGGDLDQGIINTEFRAYESKLCNIGNKIDLNPGVLDIWSFEHRVFINSLQGLRVFQASPKYQDLKEIEDYAEIQVIEGNVLDINFNSNRLTVMTENGIYCDGTLTNESKILIGKLLPNNSAVYITNDTLVIKNNRIKVPSDASCLNALNINSELHVLIGYWDGSLILLINSSKITLKATQLVVSSVLIKKIGEKVLYIAGDSEGNINIMSSTKQQTLLNIGSAPATIVDYMFNSILVYNDENVIQLTLSPDGAVVEKGYLTIARPDVLKLDHSKKHLLIIQNEQLSHLEIDGVSNLKIDKTKLKPLVRKSIKFKNFLQLSLFVTTETKYDQVQGMDIWYSKLQVINNNTFQTVSSYSLEPGVEIIDVVNTEYKKVLIDTYEEPKISIGFENILSQCFVISCSYDSNDELGSPLRLFSVDESGSLQYHCSSGKSKLKFHSLTNHANRMIIGAGDAVVAYQIDYSVADSKFTLKKVSDVFHPGYYSTNIKSVGPSVVVGDVLSGPRILKLKVETEDNAESVFTFHEIRTLDRVHVMRAMECIDNLTITADSLQNVAINYIVEHENASLCYFKIDEQINVIKKIEYNTRDIRNLITSDMLSQIVLENAKFDVLNDVIPIFVLGSCDGSVFVISLVTNEDKSTYLQNVENEILGQEDLNFLKFNDEQNFREVYEDYRRPRAPFSLQFPGQGLHNMIEGDLIQMHGDSEAKKLIELCRII